MNLITSKFTFKESHFVHTPASYSCQWSISGFKVCHSVVNNVSWNAMEQSQLPFSVHIGIVDHMDTWTSSCDDSWKAFINPLPQVIPSYLIYIYMLSL